MEIVAVHGAKQSMSFWARRNDDGLMDFSFWVIIVWVLPRAAWAFNGCFKAHCEVLKDLKREK